MFLSRMTTPSFMSSPSMAKNICTFKTMFENIVSRWTNQQTHQLDTTSQICRPFTLHIVEHNFGSVHCQEHANWAFLLSCWVAYKRHSRSVLTCSTHTDLLAPLQIQGYALWTKSSSLYHNSLSFCRIHQHERSPLMKLLLYHCHVHPGRPSTTRLSPSSIPHWIQIAWLHWSTLSPARTAPWPSDCRRTQAKPRRDSEQLHGIGSTPVYQRNGPPQSYREREDTVQLDLLLVSFESVLNCANSAEVVVVTGRAFMLLCWCSLSSRGGDSMSSTVVASVHGCLSRMVQLPMPGASNERHRRWVPSQRSVNVSNHVHFCNQTDQNLPTSFVLTSASFSNQQCHTMGVQTAENEE